MPLMQNTIPLSVVGHFAPGGAPFTGLLFLRGDQFGVESCCGGGGDCAAISFEDGLYQGAYLMGAASCPDDFTELTGVTLAPTTAEGIFEAGYRWGKPTELLSAMPEAGCCYTAEIEIPDQDTLEWAELPGYASPTGSLKDRLTNTQNALENLIASFDAVTLENIELSESLATAQVNSESCEARAIAAEAEVTRLTEQLSDALAELGPITPTIAQQLDAEAAASVEAQLAAIGTLEPVMITASPYCPPPCPPPVENPIKGLVLEPALKGLSGCGPGSEGGEDCCEELADFPVLPAWQGID